MIFYDYIIISNFLINLSRQLNLITLVTFLQKSFIFVII